MRFIECDRCKERISEGGPFDKGVFRVTFSPLPTNVANSRVEVELCERCFDAVNYCATQPPVRQAQ